jgi:hypothetical protein
MRCRRSHTNVTTRQVSLSNPRALISHMIDIFFDMHVTLCANCHPDLTQCVLHHILPYVSATCHFGTDLAQGAPRRENMSGGGPAGWMAAQSISPETTSNAHVSTRIRDLIITFFVVWPKYSELEGENGESQEVVVYRSCTLSMERLSCQPLCSGNKTFLQQFFSVWFEEVTSNVWLPGSLQQGIIFGTFQNLQTDPVRS